MSTIPLIQPSNTLPTFSTTAKRSIFSDPTVDRTDTGNLNELLQDQGNDDEYISTLCLNPSPIGKDTTVEKWTKSNRTIGSAFRPSTNEVAVFVAGKKAVEEFPIKQRITSKDTTVFLCQSAIPQRRVPFIKDTFDVFLNTSAVDPYKKPLVYKNHYVQYYESIRRYLLMLYDLSKDGMETEDATQSAQELELMEAIASVWQLAHAMFFTPDERMPIAFMLRDWLAEHVTGFDLQMGESLLEAPRRLHHPDFWPYILQCIIRGMKRSVVFMLEQTMNDEENEDDADALESLLKIVRGMPSEETAGSDGWAQEKHRKWTEQCLRFKGSPQLARLGAEAIVVIRILTGDEDAIMKATDSWEEALCAIVLYTDPNCSRNALGPILTRCAEFYLEDKAVSLLARIKIAILELDAITTVRYCGNFHPWLVAHLADVLHQYGYLDMSDIHLQDIVAMGWDSNIRDFFIMSYAQSLMSDLGLWEAIAGYLLHSGHSGRAMLSEWICHVPLESPAKAEMVLKFCEENNLTESLRSINRVMAVEEEKQGRYAVAIKHFMASKDQDHVARVVDNLMQRYLVSGDWDLDDTLRTISEWATHSVHVEFLYDYARFHQCYKNGQMNGAGRILVSLLESHRAPMKYWAVLLFDALPLLENKNALVFDSRETYVMMRCLEDLVGSQHKSEYLQLLPTKISSQESSVEEKEQQLDVVRMSLVRNLSRTFVHLPDTDTDADMSMLM